MNHEYTEVPVEFDGTTQVFCSISEAKEFCSKNPGTKILTEHMDDRWKLREQARLDSKEYRALPKEFEKLCDTFAYGVVDEHFAHVSTDREHVAYTPSHEYGVLDRQVLLKPGRYLNKFAKKAASPAILTYAADAFLTVMDDDYATTIGNTREDFARAYGKDKKYLVPSSCMHWNSLKNDYPDLKHHPAEVYAAGDLSIAYLTHKGNPREIVARTIIYPAKMYHSTVYHRSYTGAVILKRRLHAVGYKHQPDFEGARLLRIPYGERDAFYMPYIDGNPYIKEVEDKSFVIDSITSRTFSFMADITDGVMSDEDRYSNDEDDE